MKKVEAWKCGWCSRTFLNLGNARSHENACKKNPARRHCITCVHGCLAVVETVPDIFGEPMEVKGPWCGYHNKAIADKPYFIECDISGGVDVGIGVLPERNMPFTCCGYEYKGKAEWTREDVEGGEEDE